MLYLCCCSYNGLDWGNSFDACKGSRQSPLLLPATGAGGEPPASPATRVVGAASVHMHTRISVRPGLNQTGPPLKAQLQ